MCRADRNAWVAYLSAAKVRPGSCASFYCVFLSMPSHACFQINRHCIVICALRKLPAVTSESGRIARERGGT